MPTLASDGGLVTVTCTRCGMEWLRERRPGPRPRFCVDCKTALSVRVPSPRPAPTRDPNEVLAGAVTAYRLAIEEASCALRLGRPTEALAALDRVQAPARSMNRPRPRVVRLP